jgi:hypothetical protein
VSACDRQPWRWQAVLEAELVAAEESRAEESAVAGELRVQLAESLELHGEQMQAAAAAAAAELWEVGVSHTVRALPGQLRTLAFPTVETCFVKKRWYPPGPGRCSCRRRRLCTRVIRRGAARHTLRGLARRRRSTRRRCSEPSRRRPLRGGHAVSRRGHFRSV